MTAGPMTTSLPTSRSWRPGVSAHWGVCDKWTWSDATCGFVVVVAGVAMAVFGMLPVNVHGPLHFVGIMDPLCGVTRSTVATFRGDLATAWQYNPLGPLVTLAAPASVLRLAVGALTGRWLIIRVRPGLLGWALIVAALIALEYRQQAHAQLLMTTGLH